jgi:hypothetical protein
MKLKKSTLKRIQYIALTFSLLGLSGFTINLMFNEKMSDFFKGFLEGMSVTMIIVWGIYMVWCLFNKRNPYKIGD